jgi:C-terminal processing protease CtpA/Prc
MKAMRTALLYLAAGLAGGFALSALFTDEATSLDPSFDGAPADTVPLERRIAALEARLDAVVADNSALASELERIQAHSVDANDAAAFGSVTSERPIRTATIEGFEGEVPVDLRERIREGRFRGDNRDLSTRLVDAGFSDADAERIERRLEELSVAAMEQRYEAMRSGEPQNIVDQMRDGSATLRAELGDADYERYLEATGRPTRVGVSTVLSSSAAESAGIQPGDQILAYGGERVFDVRELNQVLLEGEPGEPVVVDIERDGQPIQLVIPRGPLGISSGFSRRMGR